MVVKTPPARTRRAERAEQTRRRIVEAATQLFAELGYGATTIDAIATEADVAVETVYSRFRNKANLLDAVLGPAIVGDDGNQPLTHRPEMDAIRSCTDQHEAVRLMANLSRTILQRAAQIHRILDVAAASDPNAAKLQETDRTRRHQGQRAYVEILLDNGPLRPGLDTEEATDTYATLASPATYAYLTGDRGWAPERYEKWLAESLIRLLLD